MHIRPPSTLNPIDVDSSLLRTNSDVDLSQRDVRQSNQSDVDPHQSDFEPNQSKKEFSRQYVRDSCAAVGNSGRGQKPMHVFVVLMCSVQSQIALDEATAGEIKTLWQTSPDYVVAPQRPSLDLQSAHEEEERRYALSTAVAPPGSGKWSG